MKNKHWSKLQENLRQTVGEHNYSNWIAPLEFSAVEDGVAIFHVPTTFLGNYVSQNFGDLLLFQLSKVDNGIRRVTLKVPPKDKQNDGSNALLHMQSRKNAPKSNTGVASETGLPGAPLDARFSFETFVVGKPNELAHAAAKRVAEGGPVTFNPLFYMVVLALVKLILCTQSRGTFANNCRHEKFSICRLKNSCTALCVPYGSATQCRSRNSSDRLMF